MAESVSANAIFFLVGRPAQTCTAGAAASANGAGANDDSSRLLSASLASLKQQCGDLLTKHIVEESSTSNGGVAPEDDVLAWEEGDEDDEDEEGMEVEKPRSAKPQQPAPGQQPPGKQKRKAKA
eukprot:TRINITY_DN8372_c0_g1_i1.p1 TRINITY_DN8372_c0_g1~~TRINITY_DN8372_c0_g1_i1.p1  ORF type:complete len:135 (-),score=43.20 TRINITY_DN8372_c0_g1_i1:836-1207(-)